MNCPKCETPTLVAANVKQIEVDQCSNCKGIWFDEKELSDLLALKLADLRPLKSGKENELLNRKHGSCPRDQHELVRVCSDKSQFPQHQSAGTRAVLRMQPVNESQTRGSRDDSGRTQQPENINNRLATSTKDLLTMHLLSIMGEVSLRRSCSRVFSIVLTLIGSALFSQDMPLTQVLIDGEGWQVVSEGHTFTDATTADAEGNFYFTDVADGTTVNKIAPDSTVSVFVRNVPKVSGLQFGPDGRLYGCQVGKYGRIVAFDREGNLQVIADNVQPNDLLVTRNGGIYFTETRKQQVTYIAPGGKPVAVDKGIEKPNGIALTPNQGTLAVSNYGGKHAWVFRIESDGSLAFKQPYMTLRTATPTTPSRGDGMTTDAAGRYYITSAVGLHMFDPTGRLGGVIASPQKKPLVSVAFAGPDLSFLYVACGDKIYRRKTKTRGVLYFQQKR